MNTLQNSEFSETQEKINTYIAEATNKLSNPPKTKSKKKSELITKLHILKATNQIKHTTRKILNPYHELAVEAMELQKIKRKSNETMQDDRR